MILSILIPSTHDRQDMLDGLISSINKQIELAGVEGSVEILTEIDGGEIPTGAKRSALLKNAKGEYVAFIDSDDTVSFDYISEILKATLSKPDVIGFEGWMETCGSNRENFKISMNLPYTTIQDGKGNKEFWRFNNHLSPCLREIALKIDYKPIYIQEDYDYALRLKQSGLIKSEIYIAKPLYHYHYNNKK